MYFKYTKIRHKKSKSKIDVHKNTQKFVTINQPKITKNGPPNRGLAPSFVMKKTPKNSPMLSAQGSDQYWGGGPLKIGHFLSTLVSILGPWQDPWKRPNRPLPTGPFYFQKNSTKIDGLSPGASLCFTCASPWGTPGLSPGKEKNAKQC